MNHITEQHISTSVANALQYISYYHPTDFIAAMKTAYLQEESMQAKNAIGQILLNSKQCAFGKRPICQDTGIVSVFVTIGRDAPIAQGCDIEGAINEGVRQAYLNPNNPLRCSIVANPLGTRHNTKDNTPAVIHYQFKAGSDVEIALAAKGGGSENKSRSVMLNPSDSLVDWTLATLETMGAGWCPPGVLGIGVGGTLDKAAMLAKYSLFSSIDMPELRRKGASNRIEELRLEIYEKANSLGIGAQGLGGLTTVLDVKICDYPTHAASLPVVIIPNCAANRHIHFALTGEGEASFQAPDLGVFDDLVLDADSSEKPKAVNLDTLTQAQIETWQTGDNLLLTGTIITGRDAAHKRLAELFEQGESAPVDLTNKIIYYVGPVDAVGDEVIGPAGPTTATRMDKFTDTMLANTGLLGMIGKAERGAKTISALRANKKVYMIAVGGAAYVISQSIKAAKVVAFADLGMEAMYEMRVENMPVQVAVDTNGESIHVSGPKKWRSLIASSK